jgi:protein TonB
MKTNVSIFNDEWCDLLFNGKNQRYGAYELRRSSGDRHAIAILITLSILLSALFLSVFIKKDANTLIDDATEYGKIVLINVKPPEAIILKIQSTPGPRKPQIKIAPFVVAPDEQITEPVDLPTNDSINGSDLASGGHTDIFEDTEGLGAVSDGGYGIVEKPDNTIHDIVEQMPQFPGGNEELIRFLSKNIVYPRDALENGASGTVFVQFVINSLGQVTNIELVRGFDPLCEAEAIRVIRSMPNWIPGKQNGNAVNVKMFVPVRFVLR